MTARPEIRWAHKGCAPCLSSSSKWSTVKLLLFSNWYICIFFNHLTFYESNLRWMECQDNLCNTASWQTNPESLIPTCAHCFALCFSSIIIVVLCFYYLILMSFIYPWMSCSHCKLFQWIITHRQNSPPGVILLVQPLWILSLSGQHGGFWGLDHLRWW